MTFGASLVFVVATELAPGILLMPGQLSPDQSPDGNSVLLRGDSGWVVIDTGRGGAHTDRLIRFLTKSGAPPRAVLNTHWHLDHIGGNAQFRRKWPAVEILAHPALDRALAGFHAASRKALEKQIPTLEDRPELKARLETELDILKLGRELAETEPVDASGARTVGGRKLDLHVETNAVSDGDLWMIDTESKVLIAGDLVTHPVPLFDTACPEGWREALARIDESDFEVLVPGHGEPLSPLGFSIYRKAFDGLLDCAESAVEDAACIDRWFRDAKVKESPHARDLLAYYLPQFLRPDAPGRRKWCAGDR
jgi:glyoxylase-like metal-dependent hydrolase (beta-lactamase superfamily II)